MIPVEAPTALVGPQPKAASCAAETGSPPPTSRPGPRGWSSRVGAVAIIPPIQPVPVSVSGAEHGELHAPVGRAGAVVVCTIAAL